MLSTQKMHDSRTFFNGVEGHARFNPTKNAWELGSIEVSWVSNQWLLSEQRFPQNYGFESLTFASSDDALTFWERKLVEARRRRWGHA